MLLASSASVYGRVPESLNPLREGYSISPVDPYGASKAALEHLSRTLGGELEGTGIRVIVIDPGNMNTQMHRDAETAADLSELPQPRSVAPEIVRVVRSATPTYSRYEGQAVSGAL